MVRKLSSFLNDDKGCITIRKDMDKVILKVPSGVSGGDTLFVKIYFFSGLLSRLRNFLGEQRGGIKDFHICKKLELRGVPVPEPVGSYAQGPLAGFARKSLFAAKWVENAVSVRDFILQQFCQKEWPRKIILPPRREYGANNAILADKFFLDQTGLLKFNFHLGAFVADIHKCGVYTNDLNSGNILVQMPIHSKPFFLLIDYEGIVFKAKVPENKCLSNLIQIAAFMSQADEDAARFICRGYAEKNRRFDQKKITEIVEKRAKTLQKIWLNKLNDNFEKINRKLQQSKLK